MVLSDRDIKRYLKQGKIKLTPPPDATQLGPCSIDLRLGNTFKVFEHGSVPYIDIFDENTSSKDIMNEIKIEEHEPFIIQPGEFVLASTYESMELADDLLARLEGRSSLARFGLTVHVTAGVFEPGWRGKATLELANLGLKPIALYPVRTRICAFTFEKLSSSAERPYGRKAFGSKYIDQEGPESSRLLQEKDLELWTATFRDKEQESDT